MNTQEFVRSFNELQEDIFTLMQKNGFWDDITNPLKFAEKIALVHSEVSEALEAHRNPDKRDKHLPHRNPIGVELADAVIRIMDLAEALHIDLATIIVEKHEFNASRPHKHGKKY